MKNLVSCRSDKTRPKELSPGVVRNRCEACGCTIYVSAVSLSLPGPLMLVCDECTPAAFEALLAEQGGPVAILTSSDWARMRAEQGGPN